MQKVKEYLKKYFKWIIVLASLIIVLFCLNAVLNEEELLIDKIGKSIFVDTLRCSALTAIFRFLTDFGNTYAYVTACICIVVLMDNKKYGKLVSLNLICITLLNSLLKSMVKRPRPDVLRLISEKGYSFPSGHSMISTAFYGLIIYLIYKNVKNVKKRNRYITLLVALIIVIMSSRVYLGVHYLSDVLSGCLISIIYLIIAISVCNKKYSIKDKILKKNR